MTDARSLTTSYVRDAFGDVIGRTSPDTGATTFWYDGNGAVIKQVDARSVETDYTNDVTGRVLSRIFPAAATENVTYTYDSNAAGNRGVGHLTAVVDQSGSTSFVYDALGHVTSDTREIGGGSAAWGTAVWNSFTWNGGNPYSTAFTYDPAGNVLTITYPSGRIVTYTRDALGRIASIATQQNSGAPTVTVASGATYEPFGPLAGLTFGNGVAAAYTYDQDYQLTAISAAKGGTTIQNLSYGYDPASNITSIADSYISSRSQTLTYDDLNRVASGTATGTYGTQGYTYDGVGNRLTLTAGGTTSTYAYSSSANQVATVTTGSNVRSFSYQPTGQVSRDQRDTSDIYTFAANDNGRNASAAVNGTLVGAYLYNAFEQRVQKTAGSAVAQFVFDRFGHLLAEANASGAAQKEYIWLADTPVAVVDDTGPSPVLYYIQTDQLGTPQKITDASGVVVWDGVFDPFGNAQFVGSGAGVWDTSQWDGFLWGASLTLTNLRFPGQYADAETALNQNWFRDYDPTIGRYIQSDPVGVSGGINPYLYAGAKPVSYSDPTGTGPVGFALGFAIGAGATAESGPEAIEFGLAVGHLLSDIEDLLNDLESCRIERHHPWPKFMGGPRNQNLVPMSRAEHGALHRDLNQYLQQSSQDIGQSMVPSSANPGQNIQANFSPYQLWRAMNDFYNSGPGANYPGAAASFSQQFPNSP